MEPVTISRLVDVHVGMRLEAQDQYGKWFIAKVIEVDEDEKDVLVHFDGWSSRYDEYIKVEDERLRVLSAEALRVAEQNRIKRKPLNIGDRVQAKWDDGRMYFGKVLSIGNYEVTVLFDDGVEYIAPFSHVRRRNPENVGEPTPTRDYLKDQPSTVKTESRHRRARKRRISEESQSSQLSLTSPPSSPVFVPKKSRVSRILQEDSVTETESDPDDGHIHIGERPLSSCRDHKRLGPSAERPPKEGSTPTSSDTEQSKFHKKVKYEGLRDPYKLRSGPVHLRRSPIDERSASILLTPPLDSKDVNRPSSGQQPPERAAMFKLTPPETPELRGARAEVPGSPIPHPHHKKKTAKTRAKEGITRRTTSSSASKSKALGGVTSTLITATAQALLETASLNKPPPSESPTATGQRTVTSRGSRTLQRTPVTPKTSSGLSTRGQGGGRNSNTKRSFSESQVSSSPSEASVGGKRRSSSNTSVLTRNRAQTIFENLQTKEKKQFASKVAPKELVIVWDHNEFKCKFVGCTKSFRKESLLLSHAKHYHNVSPMSPTKGKEKVLAKDGTALKSPKSPLSPRPGRPRRRLSLSPSPKSPKSPALTSILTPPAQARTGRSRSASDVFRRSKSPTESFFEKMEREQKSTEVFKLLEQSTKQQAMPVAGAGKSSAPKYVSSKSASRPQSTSSALKSPGQSTIRPSVLKLPGSHPKLSASTTSGGSKHVRVSSKRPKLSTVQPEKPLNLVSIPLKFPLVEIKALSREALTLSSPTKRRPPPLALASSTPSSSKATSHSAVGSSTFGGTAVAPQIGDSYGSETIEEMEMDQYMDVQSPSYLLESGGEEKSDDVVHCICGSTLDEGFMIQCEQCLCWQHGDCIGMSKDALPEKYLCYFCSNPPGLRLRLKYRYDRGWFTDGTLPSFPGGPKFTDGAAICKSHKMSDALYNLRKMVHSTKVKLQAASNPNHPYLKQWAKDCGHLNKEDLKSYVTSALQPISYDAEPADKASLMVSDHESASSAKPEGEEGCSVERDTTESSHQLKAGPDNGKIETATATPAVEVVAEKDEQVLEAGIPPPAKLPRHSTSPVNMAALSLVPLPPPDTSLVPHTPPPPLPPSSSSTISLEVTLDPKSLKLAPLPPLNSDDLQTITSTILKPTPAQSTSISSTTQTSSLEASVSTTSSSESALKAEPSYFSPGILSEKTGVQTSSSSTTGTGCSKSILFESVVSDVDLSEEFGVQEMAVFAIEKPDLQHPKGIRTDPENASLCAVQVPVPLSPSKIPSSPRSAFKPVVPPSTSSSSQLVTLLADQSTNSSSQVRPTVSFCKPSVKPPTSSQASTIRATPISSSTTAPGRSSDVELTAGRSNPISSQTTSSLGLGGGALETVPLGQFIEAFMQAEGGNWCQRMLLLDHIDAVQDKMAAWMDSLQKQLQELPAQDADLENMASLLQDVQSTVRQLSRIQQSVSASS